MRIPELRRNRGDPAEVAYLRDQLEKYGIEYREVSGGRIDLPELVDYDGFVYVGGPAIMKWILDYVTNHNE